MNIHVEIRRFLEIHAWICYGFSDQGNPNSFFFKKKNGGYFFDTFRKLKTARIPWQLLLYLPSCVLFLPWIFPPPLVKHDFPPSPLRSQTVAQQAVYASWINTRCEANRRQNQTTDPCPALFRPLLSPRVQHVQNGLELRREFMPAAVLNCCSQRHEVFLQTHLHYSASSTDTYDLPLYVSTSCLYLAHNWTS